MKVFRFDPDIALTIVGGSANSKFGQLTGSGSLVQAGVLFLNEGSRHNPQESKEQQMFAIATGSCIIEADGFPPFLLQAGKAALANPDEDWWVTSLEPVVALLIEGTFDVWAVSVTQEITVIPYNESWPESFEQIYQTLWPQLENVALRIDHVGSTAVPGLAAKPIIDIDVVAEKDSDVSSLIDQLKTAGYRWRGDLGVVGREAFSLMLTSDLPEHQLYLVVEKNRAHLDHLLLRDLLRDDAQVREEYAKLKTNNVKVAAGNMDVYVAAKAHFVARLLTRARRERGLPPVEYWTPG